MKKKCISVLIPVYNSEKTLRECLDSVLNQTLREIEIIITNDGSKDNSEEIIKEYLKKDDRIVYSKQENSGLGATRNKGIELANGEYIAFLDSDDWVESDYYEKLYKKAKEKDYDLVISSHITEIGEKQIINKNLKLNKKSYFEGLLNGSIHGFSWNKLYKKSLITENKLKFPLRGYFENVEDQYFSVQCVYYAENIEFVNDTNIHYVVNKQSIVQTYQKGLINDREKLYQENKKLINSDNTLLKLIDFNLLIGITGIINNEFKRNANRTYKQTIEVFNELLVRENYKQLLENLQQYKAKINYKNWIYLNLLSKNRLTILYTVAKLRCKLMQLRGF